MSAVVYETHIQRLAFNALIGWRRVNSLYSDMTKERRADEKLRAQPKIINRQ